jgi:hypothetical protein
VKLPKLEDLQAALARTVRLMAMGQTTYERVKLEGKGHFSVRYVPRNHRPERKEAIEALVKFLDEHPDLRIGQALIALAGTGDSYQLEDVELIHAVRNWKTNA